MPLYSKSMMEELDPAYINLDLLDKHEFSHELAA